MKIAMLVLAALMVGVSANATVLRFQNLTRDWTAHQIEPGSPEAAMAKDAQAVLNYHETRKTAAATVYVREFPMPEQSPGENVIAWHNVLFNSPALVNAKVITERVVNVRGQWRYVLHFETESGMGLQSIVMATVTNGKLETFLIEQNKAVIEKVRKPVLDLYKNVAILSTSH